MHTHTRRGARARLLARKILNVILTDDVVSLLLLYTIYTFILSEVWRECERAREWTYSFHISHFALFWPCMTTHFYIVAVSFCFSLSFSLTHARSLSLSLSLPFCGCSVWHRNSAKTCITHTPHTYSYFCFKTNINSHYGLNFCSFVCFVQSARVKAG